MENMKARSERRMRRTISQAHDGPCGKPSGWSGRWACEAEEGFLGQHRAKGWPRRKGDHAEKGFNLDLGRLKIKTCDLFLSSP